MHAHFLELSLSWARNLALAWLENPVHVQRRACYPNGALCNVYAAQAWVIALPQIEIQMRVLEKLTHDLFTEKHH